MPAQQQHWIRTAFLSGATGPISIAAALVSNGTRYVVATATNRASYGRSEGIALSAGDDDDVAIELQSAGVAPNSVTGLGAGAATWVIVSSAGALQRKTTPVAGDDVIGRCNARGDLFVQPGVWDETNTLGGVAGTPGGSTTQVQFNDSSALGGDSGLTYDKTGNVLSVLGGLSGGASPATFGEIRLTNNWFIWARSSGSNVSLLGLDSSDVIQLGASGGGGAGAAAAIYIDAGFSKTVTVAGQGILFSANNYAFGHTDEAFGGGVNVVSLKAGTSPSGGVAGRIIFVNDSGTLKYVQPDGTVITLDGASAAVPGTCTLEQFGAVGDGVTDDSAAWDAAAAALNAGTYGALLLGAKTYLVGSADFSFGFAIIGQGPTSILKTTADLPIIRMYDGDAGDRAKTTLLRDFALLGNSTGAYQYGIESGTFGSDGSSRLRVIGVEARNMGGAGFAWAQGATTGIGPQFVGCRAISCLYGFYAGDQADLTNCQAASCGTGVYVQTGNVHWSNGDITGSTSKAIEIVSGANDGHGIFANSSFNHNPSGAITIGAISNGHTFVGCHIYETPLTIGATTGLVQFTNCVLDVTTYTMSGLVKFDSCRFDSDYFAAYNESGTPDVTFLNCRSIAGELPSFIYDRTQVHYTFPSDANQTLTAQQSRAETIVIQDGVTTAMRTITSAFPPTKGRKIQIINLHATQNVQFKWSSGTGLNVGTAGTGMIIGADGTNALQLGTP